jgi:hypothetical protein
MAKQSALVVNASAFVVFQSAFVVTRKMQMSELALLGSP